MTETVKAKVAKVPIGHLEIDGLMMPDGSFGVALTQAWTLIAANSIPPKNVLRASKALLGEDSVFPLVSSELAKRSVYVTTLPDFERLLAKADRAGHKG